MLQLKLPATIQQLVPAICLSALFSHFLGCNETPTTRYETIADARTDIIFKRGWVPDVLPDQSGPLIETHDLDTNSVSACANFASSDFDLITTQLENFGFAKGPDTLRIGTMVCDAPIGGEPSSEFTTFERQRNGTEEREIVILYRVGKFYYKSPGH